MNDYTEFLNSAELATVKNFITSHWEETLRTAPEDEGTLLALPYPYTVPSRKGAFQELYYWDTYFTCLGLIESGRADLALFNTRNLLSQLERFGFVPNGNRTFYLTRSQPPYLASLVQRVAATEGNAALLQEAMPLLRREYEFWITKRSTPTGLSHYGHHATRGELLFFHEEIAPRTGLPPERENVVERLSHIMAECESGWDFNPRFDKHCDEFCAVDLNCLLYGYEVLFASDPLLSKERDWLEAAAERKTKLNALCWDEQRGGFFDYDFVNERRSEVACCASFQALWAGIASEAQADTMVKKFLPELEFAFGVAACGVRQDNMRWQWDYPNGWPCMQEIVASGLQRYGFTDDARRVAAKYLASVNRSFRETGDLWEKYNVENGTPHTFSEPSYPNSNLYGEEAAGVSADKIERPPAMMGWTAGVFMSLLPWTTEPLF